MGLMTALENSTDNELIEQVCCKDTQAYRILYHRYASAVLGLSYRMIGDRAAAEEIMQEVFWRIWENAESFNSSRGSFTNWMFGITRNLSIDTIRRRSRIQMETLPEPHNDHVESSHVFKADHDVPEIAWTSFRHQQITVALERLPSDQRDVIQWIYFEGKTRREIASEKGIPFGTINTRAKLALKKLQRALETSGVLEE